MATREIHHLRHLGLGDLVAEYANHGHPLLVHRKHDLERLRMCHAKEPLKDMHDEFHRRVIVIQQKNLVERRALCFGARLQGNTKVAIITIIGGHMNRLESHDLAR